jgi:two-component system, sensor histidine kinase
MLTAAVAVTAIAAYALFQMWGSLLGLVPLTLYVVAGHRAITLDSRSRIHVMLALLLFALVAGAVTERPITMGNLSWTLLLPMVSTLLLGPRAGLFWLLSALAAQGFAALAIHLELFPSFEVPFALSFQTLRFAVICISSYAFSKQAYDRNTSLLRKAQAADEAKSVFLANISHEIRTPLNGVLGMTEAMLQRPLPQRERADLEVVQRSGVTLMRLINDLLDLTKAERGDLPIEAISFDLDQLLRDVMEFVPSRPTVDTRLEADRAGTRLGDPTRLRQILTNLLSNASKFTADGVIVMRAKALDLNRWSFEVSDSGMGMSPETVATLFTPFKQADASIARRFGGTGLGLALVKTLAERMGGAIAVTSNLGQGTTFRVELPLPPSTAEAARPAAVPSLDSLSVLVVDDNAINLRVAEAMLSRVRCRVTTAETGEAALALLATTPFDVVLMDCQLPGISGWEATERLHSLPGCEALPVIALTASASHADAERSRTAGMLEVLTKPLAFTELCRVLQPYGKAVHASGGSSASTTSLAS